MTRIAITTFILKIASRCNLACTYCYMYNGLDQSWKQLPRFMSLDVASSALDDIRDYAFDAGLASVAIIFHGGEPTLYPPSDFSALIDLIHEKLDARGIESRLSIQTNLTVARPRTRALLLDAGVAFGISVDLTREAHDRQRIDRAGIGSFDRVIRGLAQLRAETDGQEPRGALMVIDPQVRPEDAFDFIDSLEIDFVDVLLPDETWDTADVDDLGRVFGEWLLDFFELYRTRPRRFTIRWFQTALKLAFGGKWGSDMLGVLSAGTVILDTDGTFDFHDVLRMAGTEINDTRIVAGDRAIDAIENLDGMQLMMHKTPYLAEACVVCPVVDICGGGHVAHRFSQASGLANPSVYCKALLPLYTAMRELTGA